jgi:dynein heavy chain
MDNFEGLLEREIIQSDLERKHADLMAAYNSDLKVVQEIFMSNKAHPPINDNQPPKAGAIAWCRSLIERVELPMSRLKTILKGSLDSEGGKEVARLHHAVTTSLNEFEQTQFSEWCATIEAISEEKLNMPLLRRGEEGVKLRVNFDDCLTCLLREVRYLILLGIEVPALAMTVYKNSEIFHENVANMEIISNVYNRILETLIDVERPLVADKLDSIDSMLQRGLTQLNWKSMGIAQFIRDAMDSVKETDTILSTLKFNVQQVQKLLSEWSENPVMDRKSTKTYVADEFITAFENLYDNRTNKLRDESEKLHNWLLDSNLTVRVPATSMSWKEYANYVNSIAIQGLARVVTRSQQFLLDQLDGSYVEKNDVAPLLLAKLELQVPNIEFSPPMGSNSDKDGIRSIVKNWVESFTNISTLMLRLDTANGDYLSDIQEDCQVKYLTSTINSIVNQTEVQCIAFRDQYAKHAYLWTDDLKTTFAEFIAKNSSEGGGALSLKAFDDEIQRYAKIKKEVNALPESKVFVWIKVDANPLRAALNTWLSKWTNMYMTHMQKDTTTKLSDLYAFMNKVNGVLQKETVGEEGEAKDAEVDPVKLMQIMVRACVCLSACVCAHACVLARVC